MADIRITPLSAAVAGLKVDNPYKHLEKSSFWRSGVADVGLFGLADLWESKWRLPNDARFVTFGSCFAQHISRALRERKMDWFNAEPAPGKTPPELAKKYNYDVFSARTGNIYTAAQLIYWIGLANEAISADEVEYWTDQNGRVWDLLRPRIEPNGFGSLEEAQASVASTGRAFARCIREADVFIFTLGLTEGWVNSQTGQSYTICPGTGVGEFEPERHQFHNYGYVEIAETMRAAAHVMWDMNPDLHILLTVSPVPLVATASDQHVLVATQYSKSVLRSVAGELSQSYEKIDYFPSYEIISSPPSRAMFFEPDMRSVAPQGVDLVMKHVFSGLDVSGPSRHGGRVKKQQVPTPDREMKTEELVCEELILEAQRSA